MDEDEGLIVGIVFERSLCERKCGGCVGDSGSKRKLERDDTIGDDGAELPFSVEGRLSRRALVEAARWRAGRLDSVSVSWKRRHDSRCRAMRDWRRSCGGMRVEGTGTMAPLGTVRRAECRELRRLLGREVVLREAERECVVEVEGCELRLGEGGSIRLTLAISDGDIGSHLSSSVIIGDFVERVKEGCRARHVTDAIREGLELAGALAMHLRSSQVQRSGPAGHRIVKSRGAVSMRIHMCSSTPS